MSSLSDDESAHTAVWNLQFTMTCGAIIEFHANNSLYASSPDRPLSVEIEGLACVTNRIHVFRSAQTIRNFEYSQYYVYQHESD